MPHEHWELNATSVPASKNCANPNNPWTDGTNTLTSTVFPLTAFGAQVRRLYLQRATTHNIVLPAPGASPIRNSLSGYLPSPDTLAEPDLAWVIIKTWNETDIPDSTVFPISFSETAPHSTFYYYRLSLVWKKFAGNPQIGSQWDSNIATIVQPFDLSICQTDECTHPQNCTPRLIWDAPQLAIRTIVSISRVGLGPCCNPPAPKNSCYEVIYQWPYSSNFPTVFKVYKAADGVNFNFATNVVPTACAPWYDDDTTNPMYYRFDAQLASNSVVAGNIVKASY